MPSFSVEPASVDTEFESASGFPCTEPPTKVVLVEAVPPVAEELEEPPPQAVMTTAVTSINHNITIFLIITPPEMATNPVAKNECYSQKNLFSE
jgi:hypothetical protein